MRKYFRRTSVSLPPDLIDQLDDISSAMGISRSALLSSLLSEALPPLAKAVEGLAAADAATDGVSRRRYRGEVIQSSRDALDGYMSQLDQLEADQDEYSK